MSMDSTIDYYNRNFEQFISDTLGSDMSELYTMFLERISKDARILDLGCGSGRDSDYFLKNGYEVVAMDGSEEFCMIVKERLACEVHHLSFDEIRFENEFDGIWACASLLHLPKSKLPGMFNRLFLALKEGGVLYCSFKYGNFEGERSGRYFTDLTEDTLEEVLRNVPHLKILSTYITRDVREDRKDQLWLNVMMER